MAVWDEKQPKIAICIPYQITVTMQFAFKTLGPLVYAKSPLFEKVPKMVRNVPVSVARDELVRMALDDKGVTHLLWLDSDEICESPDDPNEALRMLFSCNVPIVSGLYRAKQKEGFGYAAWLKVREDQEGYTPLMKWEGNFFHVGVVGMGFCLMKREVFERIEPPWFPWSSPTPSEDFNFCMKARAAGFNIDVFAGVKLSHEGNLMVSSEGVVSTLSV